MSTAARRCTQLCISSCANAQNALLGSAKCHIDILKCIWSSRLEISRLKNVYSKLKRYATVYLIYT